MSLIYNPEFLHDRVYEGLWTRYHGPRHSSRILTMSTYRALFVFAVLLIVVEYASGRLWVILRYLIYHSLRKRGALPVHLPSTANNSGTSGRASNIVIDDLELEADTAAAGLQISRTRAIFNTFSSVEAVAHWILRQVKRSPAGSMAHDKQYDPGQSPCFGIAALVCVLGFLSLGVAAPYALAEGAFGAPIVKTKAMEDCIRSAEDTLSHVSHFLQGVYVPEKTDSIFRACDFSQKCFDEYQFKTPRIEKRWLKECPFSGDICHEDSQSLQLTHRNISAFELGMNSPAKWVLNHRTTCAPLRTADFLLYSHASNKTWISVRRNREARIDDIIKGVPGFTMKLETQNGPNWMSNTSSGTEYRRRSGRTDTTILPSFYATSIRDGTNEDPWGNVHELLNRNDSISYMIVHREGGEMYNKPSDDPFFSAHEAITWTSSSDDEPQTRYASDYEATAIGCLDQFQICVPYHGKPIGACSAWHRQGHIVRELLDIHTTDEETTDLAERKLAAFIDAYTYLTTAVPTLSMYHALALRHVVYEGARIIRTSFLRATTGFQREDANSQWASEVEEWFMKALVDTIISLRASARYSTIDHESATGIAMRKAFGENIRHEWIACDMVLLRDSGYTNINWYGFCSTIGALVCICLVSFCIEAEVPLRKAATRSSRACGQITRRFMSSLHTIRSLRAFGAVLSFVKVSALLNGLAIIRDASWSWRTWQYAARPPRTSAGAPGPTASASTTTPDVNDSSDAIGLEDLGAAEEADDPI